MGFGMLTGSDRPTHRAPVNPLDKSTIVSIFPMEVDVHKLTLMPSRFIIPAGTYAKPSSLTIGPSSWWKDFDLNQPLVEMPTSSILMAKSIIDDYCNGILGCNMDSAMPGMFFIPGEYDNAFINNPKSTYKIGGIETSIKSLIEAANVKQRNWFQILVQMADSLWSRSNGNPLAIDNLMRIAARELNLNDKPWLKDYQSVELVKCVACGALRNAAYPICQTCKAIVDPAKAKELNLTFAQ